MFGAVLTGGAALASGYLGAEANRDAAHMTSEATRYGIDTQRQQYDTTRADLGPYRDAGVPALQRLMHLTGVGPDMGSGGYGSLTRPFDFSLADLYKDPSYQFRLDEGNKALERSMASRGLSSSTPGLQALMRYNQDYASTEYGSAFGRAMGVDTYNRQTPFNMLSYLAGTGQNASAMTGQVGANMAAGVAGTAMAGAGAQAGYTIGGAGAINNAIQGGLGNYMYQQRFDQLMQRLPVLSAANSPNYSSSSGSPNYFSGAAGAYG